MTPLELRRQCARSWEVEAVRDGRLSEQDAESFRRHLRTCAECQREEGALDALGRGLTALPRPHLDVLGGRRVRQRVLTTHNAWLLRHERAGTPSRAKVTWVASAAAVLFAGATAWHVQRGPAAPATTSTRERPPEVDVVASSGSRWSRTDAAHSVQISLDSGKFQLSIRRHNPADHVVVVMPDGDIEDVGTVLAVAVSNGVTESVRIEQGSVMLSLRNEKPLLLSAGQSWQREHVPAVPSASAALGPVGQPTLSSPRHHVEAGPRRAGTLNGHGSPTSASAPSVNSGPSAETEDDEYLHVIELMQVGKLDAARAAAKHYLLRFPTGFRRVEMLDIATGQ